MSKPNTGDGRTEERESHLAASRRSFLAGVGALAGSAALGGGATAVTGATEGTADGEADSAITFITDGMGHTQITGARYLKAYQADSEAFPLNVDPAKTGLQMDRHEAQGTMTVFPDDPDELVTDSGAAATALSTIGTGENEHACTDCDGVTDCAAAATSMSGGVKAYNGAIGGVAGEDGEFVPVETVLEAARDAGKSTGLVTNTRITHATPAAFGAHVPERGMEDEIARQYIEETGVDVLLGGGKAFFDPEEREDGEDLLATAEEEGYELVETADELDGVDQTPVLGLFTDDDSHMNYYLDRLPEDGTGQPGLPEMVEKAIELLSENEEGFFLMVESGRVDHCGHANDPAIAAEQLEGDEAVGACLDYVQDDSNPPTTMVTTADHECGGMSLARDGPYNVNFDVLDAMGASATEGLAPLIEEADSIEEIRGIMDDHAGIDDMDEYDVARVQRTPDDVKEVLNERALVGWTSDGHTAADVPTFASGPNAEFVNAARDNTDMAGLITDSLGL
ncbi:alkaline phosphatase [Halalkalicoccus tibetensis]|uniref:Alkaline phosphatase n=1 Tax=Halalkalicoccus tibetensis TaxID=175632 RepID=A0ABD5V5E4_9EURY